MSLAILVPALRRFCEAEGLPREQEAFVVSERLNLSSGVQQKHALLSLLLAQGDISLLLYYSENPIDDGVEGNWRQVSKDLWFVPCDANCDELLEWLFLGNWAMKVLSPDASLEQEASQGNGEISFEQIQAQCEIAAFHDNDPWYIKIGGEKGESLLAKTDSTS